MNPANANEIVRPGAADNDRRSRKGDRQGGAFFPRVARHSGAERAEILFKAAEIMRQRRWQLAATEIFEVGKGWREADADVCEAIDYLDYYAHEMLRLAPPRETQQLPSETNTYFYEPRGVAAVIAPWNFPLAILTGMTAAALVDRQLRADEAGRAVADHGRAAARYSSIGGIAGRCLSIASRRRRDRRAFGPLAEDSLDRFHRFARGGLGNSPRSLHASARASSCEAGGLRDGRQERA